MDHRSLVRSEIACHQMFRRSTLLFVSIESSFRGSGICAKAAEEAEWRYEEWMGRSNG